MRNLVMYVSGEQGCHNRELDLIGQTYGVTARS